MSAELIDGKLLASRIRDRLKLEIEELSAVIPPIKLVSIDVGDSPAQEVFEAPGINLKWTPQRIRKEFYHRWCRDPLRIDPTTKMTRFTDDEGLTGLTDVLEGEGEAQFEAIWRYLQSLSGK